MRRGTQELFGRKTPRHSSMRFTAAVLDLSSTEALQAERNVRVVDL
jgi:hypothetical protein